MQNATEIYKINCFYQGKYCWYIQNLQQSSPFYLFFLNHVWKIMSDFNDHDVQYLFTSRYFSSFFNVLMKALHDVDDGFQIYSYTFLLNILVTLNFWYKFIDAFFKYKPSWGRVRKCLKGVRLNTSHFTCFSYFMLICCFVSLSLIYEKLHLDSNVPHCDLHCIQQWKWTVKLKHAYLKWHLQNDTVLSNESLWNHNCGFMFYKSQYTKSICATVSYKTIYILKHYL